MIKIILFALFILSSCFGASKAPPPSSLAKNLDDFLFKSELKTDSIILYKDGKTLQEKYNRAYTKDSKHIMWSVSKSFTNAVVGMAVKDGKIKINQSICDFYPNLKGGQKCAITINDLLQYTAGFEWSETYEPTCVLKSADVAKSDVFQMNYGKGFKDSAQYVLSKKLKFRPGTANQYNTGTPNVLMDILKRVYQDDYKNHVSSLFSKLGNENYVWARDESGTYLGGTTLMTTPQTMLSFGLMYLNNGMINGEQVLTKEWVDYTRTQSKPLIRIDHEDVPGHDVIESMGALFWLNTPVKGKTPWPDAPADTYIAWGHWSQFIVIIPSQKVVIVRTGEDKRSYFDINKFIKLSLQKINNSL